MIAQWLFSVALSIPFGSAEKTWQVLEYNGLPPNQVVFAADSLTLKVDRSASPVIFPLPQIQTVSKLRVSGYLSDLIPLKAGQRQGGKSQDDFTLRVGLVVKGDKRLNWVQKKLAAKWVLKLYDLAPDNTGIDHILFYNAVQDTALLQTERLHPASDLIKERFAWQLDKAGAFAFEAQLPQSMPVVAVWLSSDGDDTGAKYDIRIEQLALQ